MIEKQNRNIGDGKPIFCPILTGFLLEKKFGTTRTPIFSLVAIQKLSFLIGHFVRQKQ